MAKKRKGEEEAPENSERWLLTYSDMITLLLALFIILYSMSTIDAKKFAKVAESMGNALGTATSQSTTGKVGAGTGKTGTGTSSQGKGSGTTGVQVDALDEVYNILQAYVDQNHLQDQIGLVNTNTYVKIHLKDKLMFVPDSATMLSGSEPVLKEIEGAIDKVYDRVDHITFSGNTADVGPHTTEGDQVSWRLSTDRAVTVLNKMIGYGLQQDKISIEGNAHFDPIANNNTEEGRAKNRRVEITIYKTPTNTSSTAAGAASQAASSSSPASSSSAASSAVSSTSSK
ncbi:MAG TPA: flagellar motor protein MotB [Caproiciproducens sp.]|nr:flagellar motor protein MotB [Caproiciproducens sp.]